MQKQILTNIAIIRPILILLLVFYHAFAIYSGGWKPINGFPEIPVYRWLDKYSYAFMLETFVFVSGYVLGYQVRTKGESKLGAKSLLLGKFKRLMIPSMVFSLLYIVLLQDISQPILKTVYDVVNGVGHMWFLPMLFWCFVGIWLIEKVKFNKIWLFPILLILSILPFPFLPLHMNISIYYMFFFYVGYFLQRNDVNLDKFYTLGYSIGLIATFIIIFPLLSNIKSVFLNNDVQCPMSQLAVKVITSSLSNLVKVLYSSLGLTVLFVSIGYIERKRISTLPKSVIDIGGLCMGVYLFQQFILQVLYYHTNFPAMLGPIWLPWVGFCIALIGSLLLAYIVRLTKMGRFLIG